MNESSSQRALALVPVQIDTPLFMDVAALFQRTWPDRFSYARDAASRLRQHARNAGFRAVAAVAEQRAIGFVYGYTNAPGQWWYDQIVQYAARLHAPHDLAGSFAFTELMVDRAWRHHGVGRQLHDAILRGLPHGAALLSTQTDNEAALALYRSCGWETLIPQMRFDGSAPDFTIFVKQLR